MTDHTTHNPPGDKRSARPDWGGMRSIAAGLALLLSAGLIAKLMWTHQPAQKRIVHFEITRFHDSSGSDTIVTARTRTIHVNSNSQLQAGISPTAKQIQLPSGRWVDCRGNCARAYRAAQFR